MQNWQAQLLRLTIFTDDNDLTPQSWWDDVVGEPPDTIESQPKIKRYHAKSNYGLGILTLTTQPDRIDWVYLAAEPNRNEEIASIGMYEEALTLFSGIVEKWMQLASCPNVNRIAYGCVLIQLADSRESAYETLNDLLPSISLDAQNSSDFAYQINRARMLTEGGLEIKVNRLSKWGTESRIARDLVFPGGQPILGTVLMQNISSRLELDINTDPQYKNVIGSELLPGVFAKLVEYGNEIATEGDIP